MDRTAPNDLSGIRRILHPTDLSAASRAAFRHALKLALTTGSSLGILHVCEEDQDDEDWGAFPSVREQLERWGVLPKGSSMDDLSALGLRIRKVSAQGSDPVAVCLDHLERHRTGLLVMATSQREGPLGWPHSSVAEHLARAAQLPSLLVPQPSEGFVLPEGDIRLSSVLVPVAREPSPRAAIDAAEGLCGMLSEGATTLTLFHAGKREGMPDVLPPSTPRLRWHERVVDGDAVERIVEAARSHDLVVMSTYGRKGALDAMLGSTTERVLRRVHCPVLAIPVARN